MSQASAQPVGDYTLPAQSKFGAAQGKVLPPSFEYSVEPDTSLIFSDKVIGTKFFKLRWEDSEEGHRFRVFWPKAFLSEGKLELIAENGERLWESVLEEVEAKTGRVRSGQKSAEVNTLDRKLTSSEERELRGARSFKFCLSQQGKGYNVSYCSGPLALRLKDGKRVVVLLKPNAQPGLLINGKPALSNGSVSFNSFDVQLDFQATFASGAQYKIISTPNAVEIVDAVKEGENSILMTGRGGLPLGESAKMVDEELWQVTLNASNPALVIAGLGGVPFKSSVVLLGELPTNEQRVYLHKRTPPTTYLRDLAVSAKVPPGVKIQTPQGNMRAAGTEKGRVIWTLTGLEKGKLNQRSLLLKKNDLQYNSSYAVFRGYPYELSVRLSGVLTAESTTPLFFGEFAGLAWFERVAGWDNYWLSQQRWGVSARYYTNVTAASTLYTFSVMDAALKYRFTPGVWGHDASFGALFGYQSIRLGDAPTVSMLGVGLLWARSMPEIFDRIFNIIPLFRFPKWVDAEFLYFPSAMTADTALGRNYRLSFHGKMNVTTNFFIEAGFGLYAFDYNRKTAEESVQFGTSFATGGLGVNF